MLVLERKKNQSLILIFRDPAGVEVSRVRVMLTDWQGSKCRLGIEAPQSVEVLREELLLRREMDREINAVLRL